ncbi:hypothetical protein [Nocardioides sp. Soil805]|uniref:hypothetical protein n=1 Tax=Nocardioides sp. Soil805 TaxID=1736416 RepID=UPI000702D5D8|nr:hypothetical protein [Nocardioides sp. Soil805]KRF30344.1 hypothetical protein ASG94_20280 [Nocardioides sp. Soil805]
MGRFELGSFVLGARRPTAGPGTRGALSPDVQVGLPRRFEAVAEALVSGSDATSACAVAGRDLAMDGSSLEETMAGLRQTWQVVRGQDPAYDALSALLVAWSEAAMSYFHTLSCEDPMTGLATRAHVRSRLGDLYRRHGAGDVDAGWALVVCELAGDAPGADGVDHGTRLAATLRLSRVGEAARTVFAAGETVGRLAPHRVVVVASRNDRLGTRVRLLRSLVTGLTDDPARVWIEGLPRTELAASQLLDELARS